MTLKAIDAKSTIQNPTRRKVLKGTGAVAVAALIPAASASASNKFADKLNNHKLKDSGLAVEVADAGVSHVDAELLRVSISNQSKDAVQLSNIAPAGLKIDGQSYNLNLALGKGPLTVKPNTVRHLWLSPDRYYKPGRDLDIDSQSQVANLPVKFLRHKGASTVQHVKAHIMVG